MHRGVQPCGGNSGFHIVSTLAIWCFGAHVLKCHRKLSTEYYTLSEHSGFRFKGKLSSAGTEHQAVSSMLIKFCCCVVPKPWKLISVFLNGVCSWATSFRDRDTNETPKACREMSQAILTWLINSYTIDLLNSVGNAAIILFFHCSMPWRAH